MKTFKQFTKALDALKSRTNTGNIGFATSSASYGEGTVPNDDKKIATSSASYSGKYCGKNKICESLNEEEIKPIVSRIDKKDPFRDPIRKNSDSVELNKIGIKREYTDSATEPHLTEEQARHAKLLHDNVQMDHPHYKHAVGEYTHDSEELNNDLHRDSLNGTEHAIKKHGDLIKKLDGLINKHKLPESMHVYSGLHFDPHDYDDERNFGIKSKSDKIDVHLPAYTSTSLSPNIASKFGKPKISHKDDGTRVVEKHMMRLHLERGHKHLFTENHTGLPGEMEVMLGRNTKLKFDKNPSHIIETERPGQLLLRHHIWNAYIDKDGE